MVPGARRPCPPFRRRPPELSGVRTRYFSPFPKEYQGVHMLFTGETLTPWGDAPRINRLIFIGKNLDRALKASANAHGYAPLDEAW